MKVSPRYDGPPILEFDGAAADQAVIVACQRRRMETILASFTEEQWSAPSRCDGWSARDVIAHLITVNAFWESSVLAGLSGEPGRVLANFDPAAHPPLLIESMNEFTGEQMLEGFVASNDGFLSVLDKLDTAGWSATAEAPPGHVSVRVLAMHALWDAWIHERDIVLPLGIAPTEQADEVASCLRYAAAVGAALVVTAGGTAAPMLGVATGDDAFTMAISETVTIASDPPTASTPILRGDTVMLIEGLSVRAPLPADTPPEWQSLLQSGLGAVFDSPV